jgi:hypothetical protein
MTIGGMVLLLAGEFLPPLTDATERIRSMDSTAGREARVHRWLDLALASVDIDDRGVVFFDGQTDQLLFRARMLNSRGWFEPTTVQIYLAGNNLLARLGNGRELRLASRIAQAQFEYLAEPGEFPKWGTTWGGASSVPLAVRLRLVHRPDGGEQAAIDTLTFRVKGPG